MTVTRETLIDALNSGALIPFGNEAAVSLALSGDPSPSCISLKRGGDKRPTFHIDFDHLHATVIAPLEARTAELEAERDDLAEELDNLRSALRDRWSSVLPKDGGGE